MSQVGYNAEKELPDYLLQAANLAYLFAGVLFIGGLYFDWKHTGEMIIPMFAIADEPTANSGLFIAAMLVLVLGYVISRTGLYIESRRVEEVDQTQEWTVDIGDAHDT